MYYIVKKKILEKEMLSQSHNNRSIFNLKTIDQFDQFGRRKFNH